MSTQYPARINARTIGLDATRNDGSGATGEPPPAPPLCANPNCSNVVGEPWEETGTLCARCAIEEDLFDRENRRDRSFGLAIV